jgi:hypothetical protein
MLTFWRRLGVSISADRTTRTLVENAGETFVASRIAFERWYYLRRSCTQRVGRAEVAWASREPGVLGVAHAPPGLAILTSAAEALVYAVKLTHSETPTGGSRAWWECPACGRRCALLYLPHGRERLGCRRCCRLLYASQFPPLKRKRKRRRKRA